ncbi:unnamed protein product [Trifolium pratense]|uniref:Uncharacterized protein n=1 Tax=Trifolium pratense TaxID=57577 RepID=A0ACB0KIC3_TRIPR|nr:unnamed protein product [Trifolium pratense]
MVQIQVLVLMWLHPRIRATLKMKSQIQSITVFFFAKEGNGCVLNSTRENIFAPVTINFQHVLVDDHIKVKFSLLILCYKIEGMEAHGLLLVLGFGTTYAIIIAFINEFSLTKKIILMLECFNWWFQ